jgi:L-threonylcarbamoyladenylate synthase
MLIAKADSKNSIDIFRRASLKSEPVIFSTDTIYGIGAPLSDEKANDKIFDIKGRDRSKPFPVLVSSLEQVKQIAEVDQKQEDLLKSIWPAKVTFILKAKSNLAPLYTYQNTVAVRMPDRKWLRDLIDETGPISATSANPSGIEYTNDENFLLDTFKGKVEYFLIDNNKSTSSSAIIDISSDTYKIIRPSDELPEINNIFN